MDEIQPIEATIKQRFESIQYISRLESKTSTPFPTTTWRVPYHMDTKKITVPIFCDCRLPNDKKEYVQCPNVVAGTIQIV